MLAIHRNASTLIAVTCAVLVASVLRNTEWHSAGPLERTLEKTGVLLIMICIAGRTWCSQYINEEARQIVTTGPYSLLRHPGYLFSVLGAVGVAAQFGSIVVAVAAGVVVGVFFFFKARREEELCSARFGNVHREYVAKVPMLLPDIRGWQDVERLKIRPDLTVKAFVDNYLLLFAIPMGEGFEYLRAMDIASVLGAR